jgi:hypothetical protein
VLRDKTHSRGVIVTAVLMSGAVLLSAPPAYAFLGIADTGDVLLADLVANGVQQLTTLSETLDTARKTFSEARKVTGYAQDAYAVAASFQHFSLQRFGQRLQSDLGDAYPDAAFYRDQTSYGRWAQGGRLYPYVRYCLNGTLSRNAAGEIVFNNERLCTQLRQELGTSQVLTVLGETFGTVPQAEVTSQKGVQAAVVDAEVAAQITALTSQWNRTQRVKQEVEQMEADCAGASDGNSPSAACEAAAQRAQMEMLGEQAETNRLLAEHAHLLALQLAQRNADLKREMTEASERRAAMARDAQTPLGSETIRVKTSGSQL